jgi:FtsZ-interacting cell division protein ZipA
MNELQIGVFALGGILIVGVLAYNKWQEIRHRDMAERIFPSARVESDSEADVLFRRNARAASTAENEDGNGASERQEPGFFAASTAPWTEEEEDVAEDASESEAPDATVDEVDADVDAEKLAALPPEPPRDLLWSGIDAIAALELVEAVQAGEMLAFLQEDMPPRSRKLLRWVGLNEAQGKWELLTPECHATYRRLRLGLQLTDRESGPVGAAEFALFTRVIRQAAKAHMVVTEPLPDRQATLDQAQQLEQFCYESDIQIGVNLVSRETPFPGTKIRALAEASGMTMGNGVYARRDEKTGGLLFILQDAEGRKFVADDLKNLYSTGLVFLLDVPITPHGQYVYRQMIDTAKRFADTLDGVLIDDRHQPLSETQLAQICQSYVIDIQKRMEAAGLTPGGALARRLFC